MSMKKAPSRVDYTVETFAPELPTVYSRSVPMPSTVVPLMLPMVYELPSSIFVIETNANEDLDLPLQLSQLAADGTESPLDITGMAFEFVIRPRFDHTVVIKNLKNDDGVYVTDAVNGMLRIYLPQSLVASQLFVSKAPADHWDYFFNSQTTIDSEIRTTELFRGPLVVHAGRYPAV